MDNNNNEFITIAARLLGETPTCYEFETTIAPQRVHSAKGNRVPEIRKLPTGASDSATYNVPPTYQGRRCRVAKRRVVAVGHGTVTLPRWIASQAGLI